MGVRGSTEFRKNSVQRILIQEAGDHIAVHGVKIPGLVSKDRAAASQEPALDASLVRVLSELEDQISANPEMEAEWKALQDELLFQEVLADIANEISVNPDSKEAFDALCRESGEFPAQTEALGRRRFVRKHAEDLQTVLQEALEGLAPQEAKDLKSRFEALNLRQKYLMQDMLKEGVESFPHPKVSEIWKSQMHHPGWARFKNAPLLALLALGAARKNDKSTAIAVGWHCASTVARIQAKQEKAKAFRLDAVPNFDRLGETARTYLSVHCASLLQEFDDLVPELTSAFTSPTGHSGE